MDALRKEEQKCETDHQQLVIVPPISLDYKPADERSLFNRVIDLCKTIRPGADLTRFQIPVQFNLPKSQLQTYGEFLYCCGQDLLGACADGASPLERLLRVVAWHISTTRYVPFSQVPFNPILGETHHVSAGHLNVLLEQVSHHPPVVALYATDDVKKIRTQWSHKAVGRFHGNKVEGTIYGKRTLWLDSHHEVYELTCPKIVFRLFPAPGTEWVGTSTIKCGSNNLEASLTFKGKPLFGLKGTAGHVSGEIYDTSTGATLYEINGAWNKTITAKSTKTEESSLLFDAQAALTNLRSPVLQKKGLDGSESLVVWRPAMSGIVNRDWEAARQAKHEIEERQRHLEKKRKMEGKIWKPRYFVQVDADHHWQWCHFGETVPPAPLVIPSCHVNT